MTRMKPDPLPILYACVSDGTAVLADLSAADADDSDDLRLLAARCLAAAPSFHRLYTHTAAGRIYAFQFDGPFVFLAVADEILGRQQALLFLRRLRDAFHSSAPAAGSPLCFQDEFLPVFRRLVAPLPPDLDASPPSDAPLTAGAPSDLEESKQWRKKKGGKKKLDDDRGVRMEISVDADDDDDGGGGMGIRGLKPIRRTGQRHVQMILLVDLIVCALLFAVWLSVCRGFQCIGS